MTSIQSLLLRSESETLDFKRDNYAFAGRDEEDEAELLKDILAMANAFKDAAGYIIIGVAEENGRAKDIVGVKPMLADHDVHQFINSKTNRPVAFAVENIEHNGKSLTLIRIEKVRHRPLYLRQSYGGLQKNVVYIRHGSSTAEASPDEIKEMGKEDLPLREPNVSLIFEVVLDVWRYEPAFGMSLSQETRTEEVDLLEVTAINNGDALAQHIQGKFAIPCGFLLDYIDRKDFEKSIRDPAKTEPIEVDFSNKLREPTHHIMQPQNPLEWKPVSPGMRLCLLKEKFLPLRERLKDIDCSIRWELAVDSCPFRTGEERISGLRIVDRRMRE